MGSAPGHFAPNESPRFRTKVAPFCADVTEVTVAAYSRCVDSGGCTAPKASSRTCNFGVRRREDHPINCVTWHQASAYCKSRGLRLPSEVEWEYAARGGSELRKYPWGEASPDGRACWKTGGTCPVGSFDPGAFGLHDLSGNVWEWVADGYGPYPWPPVVPTTRVYRGGSWSRRFEKWMHTRLRNWWPPGSSGSHLGFRCAKTPEGAGCPYGQGPNGACRRGVEDIECTEGRRYNGQRCAREGEAECPEGHHPEPGFGCVPEHAQELIARPPDLSAVSRSRSAEFDGDCEAHYRKRPLAYRLSGGTHQARNLVGAQAGCKNRDVGVGWNSTCCPK